MDIDTWLRHRLLTRVAQLLKAKEASMAGLNPFSDPFAPREENQTLNPMMFAAIEPYAPMPMPKPEAVSASSVFEEDLEKALHEIRDQWSAETGQWDSSKIPVGELAKRVLARFAVNSRGKP